MSKRSLVVSGLILILNASIAFAGTITGKVIYEGDVPKFPEIKMDGDAICLTHHNSPVYPEVLVLGEGNSLANVFVQVSSGLTKKDYPLPTEPLVMDQKGCLYSPHVAGVRVGQTIKVLNPDGTLHNVHGTPKVNKEFNVAMPKFRKEITLTLDKPEAMFALKCDVHPWMGAWLAVLDHPFFSTTKEDGVFTINDLPAGQYEIEAWHEKLGTQKVNVTLAEGETKEVDFKFTKPTK